MGLKQDITELKAQIRVWERERIVQDNKIKELIHENKTLTNELQRQATILDSLAVHLKNLRVEPKAGTAGQDNDGRSES